MLASEFASLDIIEEYEGRYYEYKSNLMPGDKIIPTICAFLNSGGGNIICGIDDATHQIKGVIKPIKHIDAFLLNIDSIYHMKKIITMDKTLIGPSTITTQIHKQKEGNPVIVIIIKPDINTKYQLANGTIYYRVNASNYKITTERMFSELDVNLKISRIKKLMSRESKHLINTLQKQNNKLENLLMIRSTETNEIKNLLYSKILNEKDTIETTKFNVFSCCSLFL